MFRKYCFILIYFVFLFKNVESVKYFFLASIEMSYLSLTHKYN